MEGLQTPRDFLGFEVGQERCLADWGQITGYFEQLSASPKMKWEELGPTTEGNPMYLATISSPGNIERLEEIRAVQKRLADPRRWSGDEDVRRELLDSGKCVLLLTCGLHSTEVGPSQMTMSLGYDLLTDETYDSWLEDVVLLLVPCLNPDGLELVVDWYRKTLNTPYEGTRPPEPYHKYVDHDNNRDWFMLTQKENQLIVREVHNRWHPHIVFDQHQTEPAGPRFVLPPYIDPVNPHIDPIIQASSSALGMHIAHSMVSQGMKGVAVNTSYAAYSPSYGYQNYHGGVRLLSETASCRLATPVVIDRESMRGRRDFEPKKRTWNNPSPWLGGRWALPEMVRYQKAAALACLEHAASHRRLWVEGFLAMMERAVEGPAGVAGYLIPASGEGPTAPEELLEVLIRGLVEVYRLEEPVKVGGRRFPAGSYWIPLNQPFESYARVLLSDDSYPEIRKYPGGPLESAPTETGHNLPLLLGVQCCSISPEEEGADPADRRGWTMKAPLLLQDVVARRPLPGSRSDSASVLLPGSKHASWKVVGQVLNRGGSVHRLSEDAGGRARAGDFLVDLDSDLEMPPGLETRDPGGPLGVKGWRLSLPGIGVYKSWITAYDEGWTRWILEHYGFPYRTLRDADIKDGALEEIDVLVLPHKNPTGAFRLDRDVPPQTRDPQLTRDGLIHGTYPPGYTGGLGAGGGKQIHDFVQRGGVALALGESCRYLAHELRLDVKDAVDGLGKEQFDVSTTIVNVVVDDEHPLCLGMDRLSTGLITGGPIFDGEGDAVVQFAPQEVLANGFLVGEQHLRGRPAVLEVGVGQEVCILSALRLQYRAQTRATYPLLFNALFYGVGSRTDV